MSDPFFSPKRRLVRAKKHIRDLDVRIEKFFKKQPHKRVVEHDAEGINELHKVKLAKPIPSHFSDGTVETIEALRSALDQTAYVAATLGGAIIPKSAYFPIAESPEELEKVVKGRCNSIPTEIVAFFRTFNPYKGANNLIWALNRACNLAKHRSLIRVGMSVLNVKGISGMLSGSASIPALRWDSEKNEIIFGIVGPGGELQYDLEFTFFIAFSEVETIEGRPIIPVLATMASAVHSIVFGTEAECRRIGLIKAACP